VKITLFQPARQNATAPVGDITGPPRGEAGYDGESWMVDMYGGGPDVNPELTGTAKFDVYDEMAKTDPSIKSLLMYLLLPVRSAQWGLEPADDTPVAKVIRDMVAWNLGLEDQDGQLDLSWDELLQQGAGQVLRMGPCFEELVWDDARRWRDADGDEHLVRPLARLALRPARTIAKVDRQRGRIRSVLQDMSGARTIPGEKLSYMVFERESNHWDGVSVLRPAWGAWKMKKALVIAAGIGWDRFASGLPAIWHPDDPDAEARARRMGRGIRTHERGYVHFPVGDNETKDTSKWGIDILSGAQSLADPVPLLRWYSGQIAEAGMQQFTQLGNTETGSRATAQVQIDPFFLAVQTLAHYYRRERQRQVVRKIVEVNFGAEAADTLTPRLVVSRIQARNMEVIARAISELAPLGFQLTDRDVQDDVREMLGFGKLPDELVDRGIDPARLRQILANAGLDEQQLAAVVNALPAEVGVARNRVPVEGNGLAA
jgi:hypothetical protein